MYPQRAQKVISKTCAAPTRLPYVLLPAVTTLFFVAVVVSSNGHVHTCAHTVFSGVGERFG